MAIVGLILTTIYLAILFAVVGIVSGMGRYRRSLFTMMVPGGMIARAAIGGLSAYGQEARTAAPPSKWRLHVATFILLGGATLPACILSGVPDAKLPALLLTIAPIFYIKRLWSSTLGKDNLIDQLISDARDALPHNRLKLIFGGSIFLLFVLVMMGIVFAPVLATIPIIITLWPYIGLSRARWKVRSRIIDVMDGVLWPTDVEIPMEIEFKEGVDEMVGVHMLLPPTHSPSQDSNVSDGINARLDGHFRVEFEHMNRVCRATRKMAFLPEHVIIEPNLRPNGLALHLGVWLNEQEEPEWAVWDPSTADPHCLVAGRPGRGKSVTLRVLLSQGLAAGWQIVIADPKGVDFRWTEDLPGVKWFGGDDAFGAIDFAQNEMVKRQQWMRDNAAKTATDLMKIPGQPFQPMLVIADEAAELVGLGDKKRQEQTRSNLGSLVRRGRFIGAMVCVATQRPDVSFLGGGEVRANLGTRVLCGQGDTDMYSMALEVAGDQIPPPLTPPLRRGQGYLRIGGDAPREIQLAFVEPQAVLDSQEEELPTPDPDYLVVPQEWEDDQFKEEDEGEER